MGMDKLDKKRILLKIGSATLTRDTNTISRGKLEDIARQIVKLSDRYEFIIVSSGAIATAKQFVHIEGIGKGIEEKQALAAIGQPHLMRIIQESFRELNLHVAQCLLSYMDFENEKTKSNIINTINVLVANNYIPIINENDTVAVDEIQFGDNDILAALSAVLLDVDLMIMATNTKGLYDNKGDTLKLISDVNDAKKYIQNTKSAQGSGGMESKLKAAALTSAKGIETWLVYGHEENFLLKAIQGETTFTKIQ
jgi:glutamate 5-kinase